jgi:hypothetical protein
VYATVSQLSGYALTTQLSAYQPVLTSTTSLLGVGSNLLALNYNNISNPPNLSGYATTSQLSSYALTSSLSPYITGVALNSCNYITASTTALTNYNTSSALTTILGNYSTTVNTTTLISSALVPYSTTTAMNSAITTALTPYLTSATASTTYLTPSVGSNTFLTSGSLATTYLKLDGTNTMTGALSVATSINITGATNVAQSLYFSRPDYNICIAGATGNYSASAIPNDMILRTLANTNLFLLYG